MLTSPPWGALVSYTSARWIGCLGYVSGVRHGWGIDI